MRINKKQIWIYISAAVIGCGIFLYNSQLAGFVSKAPAFSVLNNIEKQNQVFISRSGKTETKVVAQKVDIKPESDYRIEFTISNYDLNKSIDISYDLVGETENYLKSYSLHLNPGEKGHIEKKVLNSGLSVPKDIIFRINFSGPNEVHIEKIKIKQLFTARKNIYYLLLFCYLIIIAVYVISVFRKCSFLSKESLNYTLIVVFLLFISLPIIQKKTSIFVFQNLDENRNKIVKPEANIIYGLFADDKYSQKYERYYNDNYGFRDLLIRLKNQLDYSIFKKSDEVTIGKSGWFEYKSVYEVEVVRGERYTEDGWNKISDNISKFNQYLNKRGAQLIIEPIGQKFTIYPEYAPSGKVIRPEKTAFDKLIEVSKKNGVLCVNINDVLLEKKKSFPVFYKTDFHWNEIGAFYAAERLISELSNLSKSTLVWDHSLEFEEKEGFFGGLNRSLALMISPRENSIEIKKTWKSNGIYLKPNDPYLLHFVAEKSTGTKLLPKTLVIGNSFSTYYLESNGFYEYFNEIYFLHSNNLNQLPGIYPENVKYVILQIIEVDIGNRLWNENWWPKYSMNTNKEKAGK